MATIRRRAAARGATLLELLIAMAILAVAMLGFVGTMNTAATASSVAHRRTVGAFTRSGLMDRFAVTRRKVVRAITPGVWIRDSCYDVNSLPISANPTFDPAFTCDTKVAYYQSWVRIPKPVDPSRPERTLETYVERIDRGCTSELRYASLGCVAAEMLLTD